MSIIAKVAAAVGGRGRLLVALGVGCAAVLAGAPAASAGTPMLTFYWNTDGSSVWHAEPLGAQCAGDPAMARTSSITMITCQLAGNSPGAPVGQERHRGLAQRDRLLREDRLVRPGDHDQQRRH